MFSQTHHNNEAKFENIKMSFSVFVISIASKRERELICMLSFTCNHLVSVRRDFLFVWVIGVNCVILLWHSLSLPYIFLPCKQESCVIASLQF